MNSCKTRKCQSISKKNSLEMLTQAIPVVYFSFFSRHFRNVWHFLIKHQLRQIASVEYFCSNCKPFTRFHKQPKPCTYNGKYSVTSTKYDVTIPSKMNPLVSAWELILQTNNLDHKLTWEHICSRTSSIHQSRTVSPNQTENQVWLKQSVDMTLSK